MATEKRMGPAGSHQPIAPHQRAREKLGEVTRLIELYDRACLIYCHAPLYRAGAAARYGERSEAEKWFQLAVESDPRAVQRYYEFLGEQRNVLFRAFAERLREAWLARADRYSEQRAAVPGKGRRIEMYFIGG